ncbi:IQ domain-containing protein K-like [Lycorma delicatula]|uniref:IQ domain-containing protein K-like n=1 Tax=Lycorma delicatula TaxID=130591 RepID=UPI003F51574A
MLIVDNNGQVAFISLQQLLRIKLLNVHTSDDIHIEQSVNLEKMRRAFDLVAFPKRKQKIFCPSDSEIAYLNRTVFPVLLPALARTLQMADLSNSIQFQKKTFNGLDMIVEYLWNNNPMHPLRKKHSLFKIPFVKKYLKEHPRKPYSTSCYLNEDEAATIIQAYVKGYLARSRPDVMEMRTFWKIMREKKAAEEEKKN